MHVGMAAIFQNPHDHLSDQEVYRREVALAELAEPLGFESVWAVEHHFTDYTMCPDPLQFLTYMAGRTTKAKLGTMVVVLPWHDPIRVAEQVSMLDTLSGGRLVLGLGRGLGRVEFDGFRVSMDEARDRFVESAQMILDGLENGYVEADGQFVQQPKRYLRPGPTGTFKGRTYAAAVSPESVEIMARLGVGILIIPQKPWDAVAADLEAYNRIYREVNAAAPPAPVTAAWVYCHEDPAQAEAGARAYINGYWQTVLRHYELANDHLERTRGYEHYARFSQIIKQQGSEGVSDFFMNLQVWGTPDQCYDKIVDIRSRIGNDTFVPVFSYAGMPYEDAERNMRLFARTIMPRLQALEPPGPVAAAAAAGG